jgi:hypothetical protein
LTIDIARVTRALRRDTGSRVLKKFYLGPFLFEDIIFPNIVELFVFFIIASKNVDAIIVNAC